MTDHVLSTGTSGTMMIHDEGLDYVEFWIKAATDVVAPEMPWTFTLNGITEDLRSFDFQTGGEYQLVTSLWVGYSQTVTFKLGATGVAGLGGPMDLSADVVRGSVEGVANVKSGVIHKTASVFVRDGGVWKPAEAWAKQAGTWKRTG